MSSPEDVMTLLSLLSAGRQRAPAPAPDPVFTTCPAATLCVERGRCDTSGVLTEQTSLVPRDQQVALNVSCCAVSTL